MGEANVEKKGIKGCLEKAVRWMESKQFEDGYWCAPLETNCCMEAQWLMLLHFIGRSHPKTERIIKYILDKQREDGAWDVYYGSEGGDINTTLECYFALRLCGMKPDEGHMKKALAWLIKNDWTRSIRVFTKYWLALFGVWPWDKTPSLPPEIIFMPKWSPINIYEFASWARCTMMPLSIVTARRPVKPLSPEVFPSELFPDGLEKANFDFAKAPDKFFSWENFFLRVDKVLHTYSSVKYKPFREYAIKLVLQWILERQDADGFWGGIQPPWIYAIIAMNVEGFAEGQPNYAKALAAVDAHWSVDKGSMTMLQASESPVWDTMLAASALLDAGENFDTLPGLSKALDYLLEKENRHFGDWAEKVKGVKPSGWAFERANNYYPDIDDTAVAVCALKKFIRILKPDDARIGKINEAVERAIAWLLAMQSQNGGWGAFDKDNSKLIVTKIPFCDFGEVLDPPSADVSAHVVEALSMCGYENTHPAMDAALKFLFAEQEEDGSWFGRWGVNYIYGTHAVLAGLAACGFGADDARVMKAAEWLVSKQNPDGGWGESIASYMEPDLAGKGIPSTATHTAWALIGLSSAKSERFAENIAKGAAFLKSTQDAEGTWEDPYYSGTGFPGYGFGAKADLRAGAALPQGKELARGFMLNYNYYRHYFPIMALAKALGE